MRCSHALQQVQLYIDKQLPLEEIRKLEVHLSNCTQCRNELHLLEEMTASLEAVPAVAEPIDLTANIMRRVALDVRQREYEKSLSVSHIALHPSLGQIVAAIVLATVTMLGIILSQPSLRALLSFAYGHNQFTHFAMNATQFFSSINSNTLTWAFWILGTLLGICITLVLAGEEMRTEWFKAMTDRLPVW